jgi:hypothetical protein
MISEAGFPVALTLLKGGNFPFFRGSLTIPFLASEASFASTLLSLWVRLMLCFVSDNEPLSAFAEDHGFSRG